MIIKASSVIYLFDFDGTLVGDNTWTSYFKSTKAAIQKGPYINPNIDFGIKWYVLTGRPRMDKWLIWLICHLQGLHPEAIYTYPKWFWDCESVEDIYNFKVEFIKNLLNATFKIQEELVDTVFYIDNDLTCVSKLNVMAKGYRYKALTSKDFKNEDFGFYL